MSMMRLSFHDVISVEIVNRSAFSSGVEKLESVDIEIRMKDGVESIVLIGKPGILVSALVTAAALEQTEETA